jgi:hypothetical protein
VCVKGFFLAASCVSFTHIITLVSTIKAGVWEHTHQHYDHAAGMLTSLPSSLMGSSSSDEKKKKRNKNKNKTGKPEAPGNEKEYGQHDHWWEAKVFHTTKVLFLFVSWEHKSCFLLFATAITATQK